MNTNLTFEVRLYFFFFYGEVDQSVEMTSHEHDSALGGVKQAD